MVAVNLQTKLAYLLSTSINQYPLFSPSPYPSFRYHHERQLTALLLFVTSGDSSADESSSAHESVDASSVAFLVENQDGILSLLQWTLQLLTSIQHSMEPSGKKSATEDPINNVEEHSNRQTWVAKSSRWSSVCLRLAARLLDRLQQSLMTASVLGCVDSVDSGSMSGLRDDRDMGITKDQLNTIQHNMFAPDLARLADLLFKCLWARCYRDPIVPQNSMSTTSYDVSASSINQKSSNTLVRMDEIDLELMETLHIWYEIYEFENLDHGDDLGKDMHQKSNRLHRWDILLQQLALRWVATVSTTTSSDDESGSARATGANTVDPSDLNHPHAKTDSECGAEVAMCETITTLLNRSRSRFRALQAETFASPTRQRSTPNENNDDDDPKVIPEQCMAVLLSFCTAHLAKFYDDDMVGAREATILPGFYLIMLRWWSDGGAKLLTTQQKRQKNILQQRCRRSSAFALLGWTQELATRQKSAFCQYEEARVENDRSRDRGDIDPITAVTLSSRLGVVRLISACIITARQGDDELRAAAWVALITLWRACSWQWLVFSSHGVSSMTVQGRELQQHRTLGGVSNLCSVCRLAAGELRIQVGILLDQSSPTKRNQSGSEREAGQAVTEHESKITSLQIAQACSQIMVDTLDMVTELADHDDAKEDSNEYSAKECSTPGSVYKHFRPDAVLHLRRSLEDALSSATEYFCLVEEDRNCCLEASMAKLLGTLLTEFDVFTKEQGGSAAGGRSGGSFQPDNDNGTENNSLVAIQRAITTVVVSNCNNGGVGGLEDLVPAVATILASAEGDLLRIRRLEEFHLLGETMIGFLERAWASVWLTDQISWLCEATELFVTVSLTPSSSATKTETMGIQLTLQKFVMTWIARQNQALISSNQKSANPMSKADGRKSLSTAVSCYISLRGDANPPDAETSQNLQEAFALMQH